MGSDTQTEKAGSEEGGVSVDIPAHALLTKSMAYELRPQAFAPGPETTNSPIGAHVGLF